MKFLIQMVIILLVSLLLQLFLPWWSMAIGAFAIGYLFGEKGSRSFLAGFLGVGLLWMTAAIYLSVSTDAILADKVATLFPTSQLRKISVSPLAGLFLVTSLVGGLVGGFASLTGSIFTYKKKNGKRVAGYQLLVSSLTGINAAPKQLEVPEFNVTDYPGDWQSVTGNQKK